MLLYNIHSSQHSLSYSASALFCFCFCFLPLCCFCLRTTPLLLPQPPYWYHSPSPTPTLGLLFPLSCLCPSFPPSYAALFGLTIAFCPSFCRLSPLSVCHMLFSCVAVRLMPVGLWPRMLHALLCVSRAHSPLLLQLCWEDGATHIEVSSSDGNLIYTHSWVQGKQLLSFCSLLTHTRLYSETHTHTHTQACAPRHHTHSHMANPPYWKALSQQKGGATDRGRDDVQGTRKQSIRSACPRGDLGTRWERERDTPTMKQLYKSRRRAKKNLMSCLTENRI